MRRLQFQTFDDAFLPSDLEGAFVLFADVARGFILDEGGQLVQIPPDTDDGGGGKVDFEDVVTQPIALVIAIG